jgi:HlyD family secretion protein
VNESTLKSVPTGMDAPRSAQARRSRRRVRSLGGAAAVAVLAGGWLLLRAIAPGGPVVERTGIWTDSVRRGVMVRDVKGQGTLVPEEIRWVISATGGRVDRVLVRPGTEVKADTVIMELDNPELEQQAREAELTLKAQEADLLDLPVRLNSAILGQQATLATVTAEHLKAEAEAGANRTLKASGHIAELVVKQSTIVAHELAIRNRLERRRLWAARKSAKIELDAARARVEQMRALHQLRRDQLGALKIKAGVAGVLQQLSAEVGQRVDASVPLAKVAKPSRLKAELKVPDSEARDVAAGQKAMVDTRNGIVPGRVIRVDPAVQNGTVTVDAALDGELPRGARPDLSVEGSIEIERLRDVLYVGRPMQAKEGAQMQLFRLQPGGREAVRVPVQIGRVSTSSVEIRGGLAAGDVVILSDTSAWADAQRIRLR